MQDFWLVSLEIIYWFSIIKMNFTIFWLNLFFETINQFHKSSRRGHIEATRVLKHSMNQYNILNARPLYWILWHNKSHVDFRFLRRWYKNGLDGYVQSSIHLFTFFVSSYRYCFTKIFILLYCIMKWWKGLS